MYLFGKISYTYYQFSANEESDWWDTFYSEDVFDDIESSAKMVLLFSILAECGSCGDKLLIFSQSLSTLNVIEKYLSLITQNTRNPNPMAKLAKFDGQWEPGVDYFRLDGSTNIGTRKAYCEMFNDSKNTRARFVI